MLGSYCQLVIRKIFNLQSELILFPMRLLRLVQPIGG